MDKILNYLRGIAAQEFTAISMTDAIVAIGLSFVLGLFVILIYRMTYGGVCYSKGFAACLLMLSMVTSLVILVIASNVVLSLGMVGALSIVRFRTAIKEPSDTAFAFWAIATGIVCGAGYVIIALLMTLLLGLLFVIVHLFSKTMHKHAYMVVLRWEGDSDVQKKLERLPRYQMKNKNFSGSATELVAEVYLNDKELRQLEALKELEGVTEITVMSSLAGSVL